MKKISKDDGHTVITKNEIYYVASFECYQVGYENGDETTEKMTLVWFEAGEHFKTVEELKDKWEKWDGMPWYYILKPNSLVIYEVLTETTETKKTIQKKKVTQIT